MHTQVYTHAHTGAHTGIHTYAHRCTHRCAYRYTHVGGHTHRKNIIHIGFVAVSFILYCSFHWLHHLNCYRVKVSSEGLHLNPISILSRFGCIFYIASLTQYCSWITSFVMCFCISCSIPGNWILKTFLLYAKLLRIDPPLCSVLGTNSQLVWIYF